MSASKNRHSSVIMPQKAKSAANIPEILSSQGYLKIMQTLTGNPQQFLTNSIYQSLKSYQNKIKILKGEIKCLGISLHRAIKKAAYYQLLNFTQDRNLLDPMTLEETSELQNLTKKDAQFPKKQFASFIQQKITTEQVEKTKFIEQLKDELYQEQINQIQSLFKLQDIINQTTRTILKLGFTKIKELTQTETQNVQQEIRSNPRTKKSLLINMITLIDSKMLKEIQWGYGNIVKKFRPQLQAQFIPDNNRYKGKMLMSLQQYPKLNVKRAFWNWHLATTNSGSQFILHAANQLVLHTYINKTTAFYRILGTVRKKQRKVHPRVKRMATMLFFNLRYYFNRLNKLGFDRIQERGQSKKQKIAKKLLKMGLQRKVSSYRLWMKNTKDAQKKQNQKRQVYLRGVQNIKKLVSDRKTNRIQRIISKFEKNYRVSCIKEKLLRRLLLSRIGMIAIGLEKMKNLPPQSNQATFNRANKFEKGLTWFVERILRDSFYCFKRKLQSGKQIKLKAVFILVTKTSDDSRTYFYKWKSMKQQKKTIEKCAEMAKLFEVCSKVTSRYLTEIVTETKFHSLLSVGLIHKYFSQLCFQTNQNAMSTINFLKFHATQKKVNHWFKKSATILCLNSRLNLQKATWRMKFQANSPKIQLNVGTIVKLKRMFNMIRKIYVLNMYRSFLMIAKYAQINVLTRKQQNPDLFPMIHHSNKQFKSKQDCQHLEQLIFKEQKQEYALLMMVKIFNRNMGCHLQGWVRKNLPLKKQESLTKKSIQNEE